MTLLSEILADLSVFFSLDGKLDNDSLVCSNYDPNN